MDKLTVNLRESNPVRAQINSDKTMSAHIPGVKVIDRGGTTDYDKLTNKPTLNGVEISGDKTAEDYGITGGTTDYSMLTNLPAINNKPLASGENSLASLGIGRASNAEINNLFK